MKIQLKRAILTIAITASFISGCSQMVPKTVVKSSFVLSTVVKTVDLYFHGNGIDGTKFEKVADNVYTFRWNWYRNLIIDTDDGLVIIDPMNPKMSAALKQELQDHFPNKKVHTLIYSHYHLDHTSGGALLSPKNVIAHSKSQQYWNDIPHSQVLAPTRTLLVIPHSI